MHYYQHHIGDYNRDTAHLSVTEHGVYRLLLDAYYVTESPLPADLPSLYRICRALTKWEKKAVESVSSTLFLKCGDRLTHKRVEVEIEIYRGRAESNKINGSKGGRPRKEKPNGFSVGSDWDSETEPKQNPNQEPVTSNHKPVSNNQVKPKQTPLTLPFADEDFVDAWNDWINHRKEKKKPLTPTSIKIQLHKLEDMGVDRAIEAIDFSIANGYQGIFEPNKQKPKRAGFDSTDYNGVRL